MSDYEFMRPQMEESEYLAAARAGAPPSAAAAAGGARPGVRRTDGAAAAADGCAGCADHVRRRTAAQAQLTRLTAANEDLEREVDSLQQKLEASRAAAVRLWEAVRGAGIEVEGGVEGLEALLLPPGAGGDGDGDGEGGQGGAAAASAEATVSSEADGPRGSKGVSPTSSSSSSSSSFLQDVFVEGDGALARRLLAEFRPHGTANILCACVLPAAGAGAGAGLVVLTGGADRRLIASRVTTTAPPSSSSTSSAPADVATLITFATLSGPVLSIDVRPCGTVIAASCMDGTVHLLPLLLTGAGGRSTFDFGDPTVLRAHSKYVSRVAWSPSGRFLATASADHSLAVYECDDGGKVGAFSSSSSSAPSPPRVSVSMLQQLYFARGGVEAISWVCEAEQTIVAGAALAAAAPTSAAAPSSDPDADDWAESIAAPPAPPTTTASSPSAVRVDTLVAAVRASPVLYYARLVTCTGTDAAAAAAALTAAPLVAALEARGLGQALPVLQQDGAAVGSAPRPQLWLYRVPLSEDGAGVDISWPTLERILTAATTEDPAAAAGAPSSPPGPTDDVRATNADGTRPAQGVLAPALGDDDDLDGDAARIRAALRGRHVVSSSDGELTDTLAGREAPRSSNAGAGAGAVSAPPVQTSSFIRVGYSIVDLACSPGSGVGGGGRALALAADSGVVYILPFGTNTVLRRLVGHAVASAVSAGTRLAWHPSVPVAGHGAGSSGVAGGLPFYLVASSETDFALVAYSVGSGKAAARMVGHKGTVKEIVSLGAGMKGGREGSGAVLVTCGFDKRVLVWGWGR
jgi:hypothetical protein